MTDTPRTTRGVTRRTAFSTMGAALGATVLTTPLARRALAAAGQKLEWAVHFSPTSLFFDPGVTPGTGAPLILQYAIHDALIRPIKGKATGLSLAESMEQAKDGLSYTFTLRNGLKFQNGDPLTTEDVKFSFDRYKGANAKLIRDFVSEARIIDKRTIRYILSKPWPDFVAVFGTAASGVAWVLPKAYFTKVGDEGFKAAPIGAGPYRLSEFAAGTRIVFEASEHFWGNQPKVPTLVFRVIPDPSTRLAAIRNGEVDFAYGIQGDLVQEVRKLPNLKIKSSAIPVTNFVMFASAYDKSSPWSDERVRRAANMAIDRAGMNDAAYAGLGKVSYSIIPHVMDFYWEPPVIPYDPKAAMALLAKAGRAGGFDGGNLNASSDDALAELIQANLAAVGIKVTLRTSERAAYLQQTMDKKLTGLVLTGSGAPGNAASRLQQFVASEGTLSYAHDAALDAEIAEQAGILDPKKRKAKLDAIQKQIFDKSLFMPVVEYPFPVVIGPRVGYDGVNGIPGNPYTGPYEDLTLKS
jgi:peptide/nickel transport system substrate-binding protein